MSFNRIKVNNSDTNYTHSIFDISDYTGRQYLDLYSAITDVPADKQTGGMSVKFVRSTDNKYVQYLYISTSTAAADFTNIGNWEKVNLEKEINQVEKKIANISSYGLVDDEEEKIVITTDDESETILSISEEGVDAKNLKSNGYDVVTSNYGIDSGQSVDIDDLIEVEDEDGNNVVSINKNGIKTKGLFDMNGNPFSNSVIYIAPNGNDNNDGTREHPKLSITNALIMGATTIILLEGIYTQTIDLRNAGDFITLKGEAGAKVIFKKADALISNSGNEVLVTNYTKVYKLENVPPISYGENRVSNWLFFDGLVDENTAISPADAHPCQRGVFYRNECTKVWHTSASTLSDALNEIEAANDGEYKWYYDNGTLYFNRAGSTASHHLYKSVGSYFTTKADMSLVMSNIEFRYGIVNLINLNYGKIVNCAAKYVHGAGAFVYNNSISLEFANCEASSCFNGANGDGFNGHAANPVDISAKRCQVKLIDCWSHDNNDDGYSDHEYAEINIWGGLYEWNGKGGVVPSYGSHCTCNNVYSRHNYCGFYYIGGANDYGNSGQMICYNCISEQNDRGDEKAGFRVDGTGSRMQLYKCIAINEHVGYISALNTYIDLYDCESLNCITIKQFGGTSNVNNGILVTN